MNNATWILLAIIGWGTWGVFEKLAARSMSPLLVQLCNAYVYSAFAPLMYLSMKAGGANFEWSASGILWTFLGACAATLAGYSFLFALQGRDLSQVLAWTQCYPILSFILCWALLGESFTWSKVFGAALLIAGSILMSH